MREVYGRIVTNNILINNTFHPHVWLKNSDDVCKHNIVSTPYAPILMDNWGKEIDSNFFLSRKALIKTHNLDLNKNSLSGDSLFVEAKNGNYKIKSGSPALKVGFKNFDMNVGVTLPALKQLAASPVINPLFSSIDKEKGAYAEWLGATFKNIKRLGESSAAGLHNNNGAMLEDLPLHSLAAKNKLKKGDVIIKMDTIPVNSISNLLQVYQSLKWLGASECTIIRNQKQMKLSVLFK